MCWNSWKGRKESCFLGRQVKRDDRWDTLFKRTQHYLFWGKEGSLINLWSRARLEAVRFHLKWCLSLCRDDKFSEFAKTFSQWLSFSLTFQTAKDLREDRHQARRLLTLPCVFFPPQDHCLQRLGEKKKAQINRNQQSYPLPVLHLTWLLLSHMLTLTHKHTLANLWCM